MPIHFLHQSVPFEELIALYAVSDMCLVSSTRDGMNLVSYEYIATQRRRHGVLLLSEFTGAAQSLNGSLIFNPWNTEELAGSLYDAVTMSPEQRTSNFEKLDRYVNKYTRYVATPCAIATAHVVPADVTCLVPFGATRSCMSLTASRPKRRRR